MHTVEPQVFLVGETKVIESGLKDYLETLAPEWDSDAPSGPEKMVEVMGRICYRSWAPGLNPNVTKVREHNNEYLDNILKSEHGSVLEHSVFNFIFKDVSRVFTHELVRHRAGTAISQESLRYVRLDDLGVWIPPSIDGFPAAKSMARRVFQEAEDCQRTLGVYFELDEPGASFKEKKEATSFMRRLAPMGLATTIGWSANARTLRWVLENRTTPHAEEEMQFVFSKVGEIMVGKYPNLFGDFEKVGDYQWKPKYHKV